MKQINFKTINIKSIFRYSSLIGILLSATTVILLSYCNKQKDLILNQNDGKTINQNFDDIDILYQGSYKNDTLNFDIQIKHKDEVLINEKFIIDFADSSYIAKLEQTLTQKSIYWSAKLSFRQVEKMYDVFRVIVNDKNSYIDKQYSQESNEVQGFYISYSLVCAIRRKELYQSSLEQNNLVLRDDPNTIEYEKTNTIDRGYIEGKNSFILEEDIIITLDKSKKRLFKNPEIAEDTEMKSVMEYLYKYLESKGKNRMTFRGLRNRILELEKEIGNNTSSVYRGKNFRANRCGEIVIGGQVIDSGLPAIQGGDWGCCGNYSGCCLIAHAICFWHDEACECCEAFWCINWVCEKELWCR